MIYFYENNSNKSGIYEIRNRFSNRSYIGQAKRFKERWPAHRRSLIYHSREANKFFKNDFEKCKEILGHDNFLEFHIIELMENSTQEERTIREEYWISEYLKNDYKLYNFKLSPIQDKNRLIWSNTPEESKRKISEAVKRNWQNPIYRAKILETRKSYVMSEETKRKMSVSNKKPNIGQFKKGLVPYSKGKPVPAERRKIISDKIKEVWKDEKYKQNMVDKGKGHRRSIATEFKKGIIPLNKGVPMSNEQKEKQQKSARKFCVISYLISPNNEIIKCEGVRPFCKKYNLCRKHITDVIRGKARYHKGWTLFIGPLEAE